MAGSLARKYSSLQSRWQNVAHKHEKTVEQIGRTLVTGGTGFVAGFAGAKFGDKLNVGGVPFELSGGIAAHAVGWFSKSEKVQDIAHDVGDGLVTAYMANLGRTAGLAASGK